MSNTSISTPIEEEKKVKPSRRRPAALRWTIIALKFLLSQWQILGIGVAILLAYFFPNVGRKGGVIKSQYVYYGLRLTEVSGLSIPTKTLIDNSTKFRLHLVVQIISYICFSSLVFAIVSIINASGTDKIDRTVMVGLIVMGCVPTTISSNVVMTRAAKGNDAATLIEVTIGNFLGPFLSPALTHMYLSSSSKFEGLIPGVNGLGQLYADVFRQLGCSLFAPFITGQLVQFFFPKPSNWAMTRLYLNKVGSFCLLLVVWASFSSCFYYQSLETTSHQSVILICFVSVALYIFFTAFAFIISRPPIYPRSRLLKKIFYRFPKRDTVAICFCAPAKSVSMGVPLIQVMWGSNFSNTVQSLVMVPLVLYSAEQIFSGQLFVILLRRWGRDEWMEPGIPSDEETIAGSSKISETGSEDQSNVEHKIPLDEGSNSEKDTTDTLE